MTRADCARSVRELGELMERFARLDDPDAELLRLCDRVSARVAQLRTVICDWRPDDEVSRRLDDDEAAA